mgnify:FL=1
MTHNLSDRCVELLQGLVDGTSPLPLPYPQKLSFPNERPSISVLGRAVGRIVRIAELNFNDLELKQLLFKIASWCSRRGAVNGISMVYAVAEAQAAIELALRRKPEWLASRAGVPWALKLMKRWTEEYQKRLREGYSEPPFVAAMEDGAYLVELTNGSHIHEEGEAMGHCMASSLNLDALRKRGFPTGPEALECLTYAVKLRSGELRIFSVRKADSEPVLTIAYNCHEEIVSHLQARRGVEPKTTLVCGALYEIDKLVPSGVNAPKWINRCRHSCPRRGWCKRSIQIPPLSLLMSEDSIRLFLARRRFRKGNKKEKPRRPAEQ